MKVYIAGKITGEPDYYEHFERAILLLRFARHTVLSPTILPDGLEWEDYMHICYSMIDVAEAVYFLDNWTESSGAREEFRYANHTGKRILYEREPAAETVELYR